MGGWAVLLEEHPERDGGPSGGGTLSCREREHMAKAWSQEPWLGEWVVIVPRVSILRREVVGKTVPGGGVRLWRSLCALQEPSMKEHDRIGFAFWKNRYYW